MGTFPPSVSPGGSPQGGSPSSPQGGQPAAPGGGSPAMKLAMLAQVIQGLAQQFPQGQQGITMMMQGLRQLQASLTSQAPPQQSPTPPV